MPTVTEQLLSRTIYATDGTTTNWDFSFSGGYLLKAHVKAYSETPAGARTDIVVTEGMFTGPYQLHISPALATGLTLGIYRDTPKDLPLVDFTDESGFSEISLDTNAKQAVFIAAEAIDIINTSSSYDAAQSAEVAASAQLAAEAALAATTEQAALAEAQALAAAASALAASTSPVAAPTTAATAKSTPVDADLIPLVDSVGGLLNKLSWANLKTTLASYFTPLYSGMFAGKGSNSDITSLNGPALGAATATTPTATDNGTSVATTAFVQGELTSQAVKLTGAQTIAGVKTFSSQPVLPQKITLDTAKALSGSSSTFTGIPSWVNRITASFNGVSTNGSANVILRLGSAGGGIAVTGYGGSTSQLVNGSAVAVATPTTYAGVGVYPAAGAFFSGSVVLTKITSTSWAISINVGYYANSAVCSGAYAVDISNVLDRLELSTTDIFDAGSWNILYE